MTRSKHSEDFKKEAVRLVIRNNRKIKQVAEELGVNHWTLKDWFRRYGKEISFRAGSRRFKNKS